MDHLRDTLWAFVASWGAPAALIGLLVAGLATLGRALEALQKLYDMAVATFGFAIKAAQGAYKITKATVEFFKTGEDAKRLLEQARDVVKGLYSSVFPKPSPRPQPLVFTGNEDPPPVPPTPPTPPRTPSPGGMALPRVYTVTHADGRTRFDLTVHSGGGRLLAWLVRTLVGNYDLCKVATHHAARLVNQAVAVRINGWTTIQTPQAAMDARSGDWLGALFDDTMVGQNIRKSALAALRAIMAGISQAKGAGNGNDNGNGVNNTTSLAGRYWARLSVAKALTQAGAAVTGVLNLTKGYAANHAIAIKAAGNTTIVVVTDLLQNCAGASPYAAASASRRSAACPGRRRDADSVMLAVTAAARAVTVVMKAGIVILGEITAVIRTPYIGAALAKTLVARGAGRGFNTVVMLGAT